MAELVDYREHFDRHILEVADMPAKEPSPTHSWLLRDGRRLEVESGKPPVHRICTACRRNFVHDLKAGEWYAAFPRIFDFERLDEVSERWLGEPCPGDHLASDREARKVASKRASQKRGVQDQGGD